VIRLVRSNKALVLKLLCVGHPNPNVIIVDRKVTKSQGSLVTLQPRPMCVLFKDLVVWQVVLPYVDVVLNAQKVKALVDTGSVQ